MARAKIISGTPKVTESVKEVEAIVDEVKEIQPLQAEYDPDTNTIAITIKAGHHLTIKEPKGKDFLEAEGWMTQAGESRQSVSFLILRLVLCCATFRKDGAIVSKPKMEDFLDLLDDYESMEAAGRAMNYFQDTLSDYFKRLEKRGQDILGLPE